VDVIYADFEKAFDRVDHELLIIILGQLEFSHSYCPGLNLILQIDLSSPKYAISSQNRFP